MGFWYLVWVSCGACVIRYYIWYADIYFSAEQYYGLDECVQFEQRTGSMLHPIAMGSMFLLSLSTGILGLQWRRQRTIGDEITALKKTLPDLGGAKSVSEAIAAAESDSRPTKTE